MEYMSTIAITDPIKAMDAGEWCKKNISAGQWDLDITGLFTTTPIYGFKFTDPQKATEFALRWA